MGTMTGGERATPAGINLLGSVLCAFGLLGCSNDVDALYGEGEPPILSFLPDAKAIPDCEACVLEKCAAERESCLEDDACTAQLRAGGQCDNPGCMEELRGTVGSPESEPFIGDHYICMFRECPSECQTGRNWGCAERYSWPRTDQQTIDVRVRFATGRYFSGNTSNTRIALDGATVRACSDPNTCGDRVLLDAANAAELTLSTGGLPRNFRGVFEIEGDDIGVVPPRHQIYHRPFAFDGDVQIGLIPDFAAVQWGWLPSPSLATLWVFILDCTTLQLASRIHVELPDKPGVTVQHATSQWLYEPADETSQGIALVPDIPVSGDSEVIRVQAFLRDESEPIAARRVGIRPGYTTTVSLFPNTVEGE